MIKVSEYINNPALESPCFVRGDALVVLRSMPNDCIDCVVTSPPYYTKRQYLGGGMVLKKRIRSMSITFCQLQKKSIEF